MSFFQGVVHFLFDSPGVSLQEDINYVEERIEEKFDLVVVKFMASKSRKA